MRSLRRTLTTLALSTTVISASFAIADEATDTLGKAPAAVQATVKKLVGENKMKELAVETADGKTIYDLEYKIAGVNYAADIDPSGKIIESEVEIDMSVVPEAVLAAATKAHPDGKASEASIVTAGEKMYYGIDMKVGKDTHELGISPTGIVALDKIEAPEPDEAKPADKEKDREKEKDKD